MFHDPAATCQVGRLPRATLGPGRRVERVTTARVSRHRQPPAGGAPGRVRRRPAAPDAPPGPTAPGTQRRRCGPLAVAAALAQRATRERPALAPRTDTLNAAFQVAPPVVVGRDDGPADPLRWCVDGRRRGAREAAHAANLGQAQRLNLIGCPQHGRAPPGAGRAPGRLSPDAPRPGTQRNGWRPCRGRRTRRSGASCGHASRRGARRAAGRRRTAYT